MAQEFTRKVLAYPKHALAPEDLLSFIEMKGFDGDWAALGLDDDALLRLQMCLMARPTAGGVIEGTGGLREGEIECLDSKNKATIWYVYFEEFGIVLLVKAFRGNVSLTRGERSQIRDLIAREERQFGEGPRR